MKTVGETLQSVRLKQGLTLLQISEITKIKVEFLEDLEAGEFSRLPSPVSVQGFISSYAEALGIEPKMVLSLLRRDFLVTRSAVIPKYLADPEDRRARKKNRIRFTLLTFGLGILLILGYFLVSLKQLNNPPHLTVTSPKNESSVNSSFFVRGYTDSDATLTIDTEPISLTQDGEFAEAMTLNPGDHTVTVVASNRRKQQTIQQLFLHVQ